MNDQQVQAQEQQHQQHQHHGFDYVSLKALVKSHFDGIVGSKTPLFRTDAPLLFSLFLSRLPEELRQHYTCNSCRHFFERYGGLVVFDELGVAHSAIWPEVPDTNIFAPAINVLRGLVRHAAIVGTFSAKERVLGTPVTGTWEHFHVTLPSGWTGLATEPSRAEAAKRHDFENVSRFLGEVTSNHLQELVRILNTNQLPGTEKAKGSATWLLNLRKQKDSARDQRATDRIVWHAIAHAGPGFCHPKAGIVGELVEMVKAGTDFSEMSRRMATMVDPTRYQRPQAAPSEQNVKRAEQLFQELGLASALRRRFARLDEIVSFWRPVTLTAEEKPGLFGKVATKDAAPKVAPTALPQQRMT
jgi:hypothetical protein